jgi:hypothetical protein
LGKRQTGLEVSLKRGVNEQTGKGNTPRGEGDGVIRGEVKGSAVRVPLAMSNGQQNRFILILEVYFDLSGPINIGLLKLALLNL